MDWRAKVQLGLSIVTTVLFAVLVVWAVAVRNNLLITGVSLLFFILNASVLYRTVLLLRRGGPAIPARRRR